MARAETSIDHPKGGYDDLINAAAGALLQATAKKPIIVIGCQDGTCLYPDGAGGWLRRWPGDVPRRTSASERISEEEDLRRRGLIK